MPSNRRYALDLSEVQKAMVPAAKEVLRSGIGLSAGKEAFLVATIKIALDESDNNQNLAARKLGISQSYVSNVVNGKTLKGFRSGAGTEKKKPAEQK
jgi:hypothetical protein